MQTIANKVGQSPSARDCALLALLAFAALLPGVFSKVTWLNAEERIWNATQTMLRTGDYLVPHLDGKPHLTKPPLVYWMGAATGRILGRDDVLIVRLPGMLCAIFSALMTYAWACRLRSRRVGVFAALILLSSLLFVTRAQVAVFDMPLTAAVIMAVYGAWRWVTGGSRAGAAALFAGAVLGFMIKGPVAWLHIGLAVIISLALRRELRRLVSLRALGFMAGVIVCSLPWYLYIVMHEPEGIKVFFGQLAQRFAKVPGETAGHHEPIYQYLLWLPHDLAPWTLFIPVLAIHWLRRPRVAFEKPQKMLLLWFAAGLACFSVVSSKQSFYLLPLFPAAAIAMAWSMEEILSGNGKALAWMRAALALWGVVFLGCAIGLPIFFWIRIGAPVALCAMIGVMMAAVSIIIGAYCWKRRLQHALIAAMAGWFLFVPVFFGYFNPRHRYIQENKNSPERAAYEARVDYFNSVFHIPKKTKKK